MNLNKWQRAALLGVAAAIVLVQLGQFSTRGVDCAGWVLAFAVAGALAFVGLSGLEKSSPRIIAVARAGAGEAALALTNPPEQPSRELDRASPSQVTDAERFLEVTSALARDLTPWLFERSGLGPDGRLESGARVECADTEAGTALDMDPPLAALVEEECLVYSFGVAAFVAMIHVCTWGKTAGCKDACSRFASRLQELTARQGLRARAIAPERRRSVAEELAAEMVKVAALCSRAFRQPCCADLQGSTAGRRCPGTSRPGVEALHRWLESPAGRAGNPLAPLQGKLAERAGEELDGSRWQSKLEAEFGPMTRDLIRRALELFGAPLVRPARSPASTSSPNARAAHPPAAASASECFVCRRARGPDDGCLCASCVDQIRSDGASTIHPCGGCGAGFVVAPGTEIYAFTSDGVDRLMCACCQHYMSGHVTGGTTMPPMGAGYDVEGQAINELHPELGIEGRKRLRTSQDELLAFLAKEAQRTGVSPPAPLFIDEGPPPSP